MEIKTGRLSRFGDFFNKFPFPLLVFIIIVPTIWGWMYLVRRLIPIDSSPNQILRPYMGVKPEALPWLEIWQRWDTLHYQAIAEHGYSAFATSLFTPPLYPLLMKLTSFIFNNNTLFGGLVVSLLFCAASFTAFYEFAKFEMLDKVLAQRAFIYFSIFPTIFFLFAPYTESIFTLGSIMCLLNLRKSRWLSAGIWGALAASARLTGAVIFIPALWSMWENWKNSGQLSAWVSPFLIGIASLIFPLYSWLGLGKSVFSPFEAQSQRFHGGFTLPGINIIKAIQQAALGHFPITNTLDVLFLIIFLVLGVTVWKQLPRVYGIYYFTFMALYLTRIADTYPLLSMARYVLALFPAFLVLAQYGKNPTLNRIIVYGSILGLLFLSAQFTLWGWVG